MTVTLDPTARRRNVEGSWFVYAQAALSPTFGEAIDYRGLPFDETRLAEWCEVWLAGPAYAAVGRRVSASARAQGVVYMPQVNIFVRTRGVPPSVPPPSAYRLAELRDGVAAALKDGVVIEVRDYAGDQSEIGKLIVRATNMDVEVPAPGPNAPEDLRMHAYSVDCDWIELYQP